MSSKRKEAPTEQASAAKRSKEGSGWGPIPPTQISVDTINPIRAIVDKIVIPKGHAKKLIPLSIGDPTVFGNLPIPAAAVDSLKKNLAAAKSNGYGPAHGLPAARTAIARFVSRPAAPLSSDDIYIASGCSGALTLAIQGLVNRGQSILLPKPGFSLYATICGHSGINVKYYNLDPKRQWECDLKHMESLIDDSVAGILVNNPSNPCGANYSKQHLNDILALAEKHRLPIISDEVYADMVFEGQKFNSLASLTTTVPVLCCGGIAKQFVCPGWRVGWVCVHDRQNIFKEVRGSIGRLAQLILGANTLIQSALPDILAAGSGYQKKLNGQLESQARCLISKLKGQKGLTVVEPQGAMYVMVQIHPELFKDVPSADVFVQMLLDEQMVFALPGSCFQADEFVRLVFCAPADVLTDAANRIVEFCNAHLK